MNPKHKRISDLIINKFYDSAELLARQHIMVYPIDGQGWLLLGEALMKQGKGQAAQMMFDRALLLDPKAKWMPFMQNELQKVPAGEVSNKIERLLSFPKVTVSAALIVKDEERSIERCIKSIIHAVDEIIVVDSGSTDQTLSILQKFPQVKIHHLKWNNSFAELRNEALRHVRSDWVFWLDADEWLHEEDSSLLRMTAGIYSKMDNYIPVLQPCLINHVNNKQIDEYSVPRFFQTNKGIYYSGRIHEQISTEKEGIFTSNVLHKPVGIRLHHDGYEPTVKAQKDKAARNLKLLELMTEEEPENPGWWYFLGRESMDSEGSQRSLQCFEKAILYANSSPYFSRLAEIYMLMGKIHYSQNRLEIAEEFYLKALNVHPDYPDAHFLLANISIQKAQKLMTEAFIHVQNASIGFNTYRGAVAPDPDIHLWKAEALRSDLLISSGRLAEGAAILHSLKVKLPDSEFIDKKLQLVEQQKQQLLVRSI